MASGLNRATLIGNVGREPEIKALQEGKEVAVFSLATSEVWRDKASGEKRDKTEWHRIVVFAQPLVLLVKNYVHQGSKLYIEGSIQTRKWADQSGVERHVTEIVLQPYSGTIVLLDSNKGAQQGSWQKNDKEKGDFTQPVSNASYNPDLEDEIPF
ncbi:MULTISPECIES: single-stranded DNA-binding protein [unclassified Candidatus Lariskella]|uniref:single-stranded DNA-binding protein n=1 Tax=unclassified Candidatus Lariskella TaxID=2632605 RepID=UPI0030CC08F9